MSGCYYLSTSCYRNTSCYQRHDADQQTMPATKANMLPNESGTKNILVSNPSCYQRHEATKDIVLPRT